jgi:resuscitation-promoting factor RpfB
MNILSQKKTGLFLLALFLVAGFTVTLKPVVIQTNGQTLKIITHASTVAVALRDAGLSPTLDEIVEPSIDTPVTWGMSISVLAGRQVEVSDLGSTRWVTVPASDQVTVGKVLERAGLTVSADEVIVMEGEAALPEDALGLGVQRIDVLRKVAILIQIDGKEQQATVYGPTIAQALWQAGVRMNAQDTSDPGPSTTLVSITDSPLRIQVIRSTPLQIKVDGKEVAVYSAGKTIGEALARVGFALTGLDYSVPDEKLPLPADGAIRIVRVREELLHEQSPIEFDSKTQPIPDLEIDQRQLVQAGTQGIRDRIVRVRYEDGAEVARKLEAEQILLEPRNKIQGYGTKIIPRTATVEGQTFTYWRKLTLYATAYSPCASGGEPGKCYSGTSSGKPAGRGVVAMVYSWWLLFGGQNLYIPGYGFGYVGDTGGGAPAGNHYWIDLGYDDGDPDIYAWGRWITVYFLVPAEVVPGFILP